MEIKIPYKNFISSDNIKRPCLPLTFLGVGNNELTVNCLLNIGADVSFINSTIIQNLLGKDIAIKEKATVAVQGASGNLFYLTKTSLPCKFAGMEFPLEFLVSFNSDFSSPSALLGRNILNYFNILLTKSEFIISTETISVIPRKEKFYKFDIPTKSEIIHMSKIINIFKGNFTGIIDQSINKNHSPQNITFNQPLLEELGELTKFIEKKIISHKEKLELINSITAIKNELITAKPSKRIIKTAWATITSAANLSGAYDLIAKIIKLKPLLLNWIDLGN